MPSRGEKFAVIYFTTLLFDAFKENASVKNERLFAVMRKKEMQFNINILEQTTVLLHVENAKTIKLCFETSRRVLIKSEDQFSVFCRFANK